MDSKLQKIHKLWEQEGKTRIKTKLAEIKVEEVVGSIFTAGPSYYYVIDFFDMQLSHMSPSIEKIHGLNSETCTFNDILSLIHPDDIGFVERAEAEIVRAFRNEIGWEELTNYKTSYCFRCKSIDGKYKLFLHQAVVLNLDENGGFAKALNIHTDISHLTSENNYKLSLYELAGGLTYNQIDLSQQIIDTLNHKLVSYSKREVEIIHLIADGFTNNQIAEKLHIALDTAKNHRRNILNKAEVNNTAQLIKKCMLEGLI